MQLSATILAALKAKYEADRLEAVVKLNLYLNTSVGVGEHPSILDEAASAINAIAEAEERLRVLYTISEGTEKKDELIENETP